MIGAILVPPRSRRRATSSSEFPSYVDDLNETVQENETLKELNEDFDLVGKLEDARPGRGRLA